MSKTAWVILAAIAFVWWQRRNTAPAGVAPPQGQTVFSLTRGPWSAILPDASIAVPVWPGGYEQ